MALRFADSFDHYTFLMPKWTNTRNGAGEQSSAVGRFGTKGLGFGSSWVQKLLDSQSTWVVGCDLFKVAAGNDVPLLTFYDASALTTQCYVVASDVGTIAAYRGGGTLLASAAIPQFSLNRSFYIEAKVTINNTTGVVVVKVDGATVINISSQDTQVSANASADTIYFGNFPGGGANPGNVDDVYILDATGGAPWNDFLGDVRVERLLPDGNGFSSDLVGSDADSVNNYLLVDETAPNSDTDYVESSAVGDEDTYTFSNLGSTSGTVYGVQILQWAKKTNAGAKSIASVARLAGTEEDSADFPLSTTYDYTRDIRETKPGGGGWTIADVNNAEFGPKVTV